MFGPQTFGPHQKVLEIWSYPKCPSAYLVHAKWFWTGANIKDFGRGPNVLWMFWTGPNGPANIVDLLEWN